MHRSCLCTRPTEEAAPELVEVPDDGARGLVRAKVTTLALGQAAEVYRQREAGAANGRAVVLPARP